MQLEKQRLLDAEEFKKLEAMENAISIGENYNDTNTAFNSTGPIKSADSLKVEPNQSPSDISVAKNEQTSVATSTRFYRTLSQQDLGGIYNLALRKSNGKGIKCVKIFTVPESLNTARQIAGYFSTKGFTLSGIQPVPGKQTGIKVNIIGNCVNITIGTME